MKKLFLIFAIGFVLAVGGASANWLVFYDPTSATVSNRVTHAVESVLPTAADGRDDAKVVEELPEGFPIVSFKYDGTNFVELTQADIDAINAAESLRQFNARVAFTNEVRAGSKNIIQSNFDEQALITRALALVVLDEINLLRAQASLPERTKVQLRNAIQAKIDDLSADTIE